jgi:hypothetical protein
LKFEAEGREFAKILRSLEQFFQTVKGQKNFWQQNVFLTCSWRFFISNKLEQLEFRLEKRIEIQKPTGKVRKKKLFTSKWAGIRFFVRAVVGQQFEPKTRGYFRRENLDL